MKNNNILFLSSLFGLFGATLASCSDDTMTQPEQNAVGEAPFTLTATTSNNTGTRIELGPDNLTLSWEVGDILTLQNQSSFDCIPVTCTQVDPSDPTKATFTSQYGVPAGEYWVLYNISSSDRVFSNIMMMSRDAINSGDALKMFGVLTINNGQTSANIALQHAYAKLTFSFSNMPSFYQLAMGIISPQSGFHDYARLDASGQIQSVQPNGYSYAAEYDSNPRLAITNGLQMTDWSDMYNPKPVNLNEYSAFVIPTDLTGHDIYFYAYETYNTGQVYELIKAGIKLEAGKNYNIQFDFNNATPIAFDPQNITTLHQLRAATYTRYETSMNTLSIGADIDCSAGEAFPIECMGLEGNNHIISNLTIDWNHYGAGLLTTTSRSPALGGSMANLTLQDAHIKGTNYVGGFLGQEVSYDYYTYHYYFRNCKITGTSATGSLIEGADYVGGIASSAVRNENVVNQCSTDKYCTIKGNNYVGGLIGMLDDYNGSEDSPSEPFAYIYESGNNGTVVATGDYVGGLIGNGSFYNNSLGKIQLCYNTGSVTGKNHVGGIMGVGGLNLYQCFNEGDITGVSYVGGIAGLSGQCRIDQCRNKANVEATNSYAGGIAGSAWVVSNCYTMGGTISGTNAGGIIGEGETNPSDYVYYDVRNCYSSSPVSSDNGIVGFTKGYMNINNCVTISANSCNTTTTTNFTDNSLTARTDISAYYSTSNTDNYTINGDGAFSDQDWGDTYKSLKLTWEVGFGANSSISGYTPINW